MDLLDKVIFDIDVMRRNEGNLFLFDGKCKGLILKVCEGCFF